MDKDLGPFCQILKWLFDIHKPWGDHLDEDEKKGYQRLEPVYRSFTNETELEKALPRNTSESIKWSKYLYLPTIKDGQHMMPILSVRCDCNGTGYHTRLRLFLFLIDDNEENSFGIRFESPEGPGSHNFYHAQFIREFDKGANVKDCPSWLPLPTKYPSFPVDASDVVSLILSILFSLYGLGFLKELNSTNFSNMLKDYKNKMHCMSKEDTQKVTRSKK